MVHGFGLHTATGEDDLDVDEDSRTQISYGSHVSLEQLASGLHVAIGGHG
eukprot:CAMPEP_0185843608 /NCGR_PEP_ID=MMETSP1354-20130828/42_1 /TAXON_ID=708628 /ORGANISM="Erythrolobus madagascarensis, Strain CCMP3276" /LENGTH=49 /DNA_ID= /DNA_START= /DNA_END= /DNA_ORIENTATION=